MNAPKTSLWPQLYFGTFYMVGFWGVLWAVFIEELAMTDTEEKIAMILIGMMGAGMGQVMNFLFGSSAGSKQKTDTMGLK